MTRLRGKIGFNGSVPVFVIVKDFKESKLDRAFLRGVRIMLPMGILIIIVPNKIIIGSRACLYAIIKYNIIRLRNIFTRLYKNIIL